MDKRAPSVSPDVNRTSYTTRLRLHLQIVRVSHVDDIGLCTLHESSILFFL